MPALPRPNPSRFLNVLAPRQLFLASYFIFPITFASLAAPTFGLFPGQQLVHLGNWSLVTGYIHCADAHNTLLVTGCQGIGYPVGSIIFEGAFFLTGAYWISLLTNLNPFMSFQIFGILSLAIGAAGCVGISAKLTSKHWPGILISVLYLLSPSVFMHPGIPQIYIGAFLLPFALFIFLHFGMGRHFSTYTISMPVTLFLVSMCLLNTSGYAFLFFTVIAIAITVSLVLSKLTSSHSDNSIRQSIIIPLSAILPLAVAAFIQRYIFWPEIAVTRAMPLDFYRGSSIDLLQFLIPGERSILWSRVNISGNALQFNSNGDPFPGYVILALVILTIYLIRRGARKYRAIVLGLATAAAITFLVSLGPSARLNHPWPPDASAFTNFNSRLMPAHEAGFDFPWRSLYVHPPLSLAREVQRWQIPFKLLLAILSGVGLSWIASRNSRSHLALAAIIGILAISEGVRVDLVQASVEFTNRRAHIEAYQTDVITPLRAVLPSGAHVLYLPTANDYLASSLGPYIGVRTFNVDGDKNRLNVRTHQPPAIREAMLSYGRGENMSHLLHLLRAGAVDAMVFNKFSLRWSAYHWPPRGRARVNSDADLDRIGRYFSPHCSINELAYSLVVSDCSTSETGVR